jgi:hypothetical protein
MGFGPVGRSWQQRINWAGTYDDEWKSDQYPFLPADFDERYFQSSPLDQQTHYLNGGERAVLWNLTAAGRVEFALPKLNQPLRIYRKNGVCTQVSMVVDTLIFEPDLERFTLTLRGSTELKRGVHELINAEVGRVLPQAIQIEGEARAPVAKTHYKSLAELAAANSRANQIQSSER